jgi:hypothetical protein
LLPRSVTSATGAERYTVDKLWCGQIRRRGRSRQKRHVRCRKITSERKMSSVVLDVRRWVLGVGCWVLGVGCWVLGVRIEYMSRPNLCKDHLSAVISTTTHREASTAGPPILPPEGVRRWLLMLPPDAVRRWLLARPSDGLRKRCSGKPSHTTPISNSMVNYLQSGIVGDQRAHGRRPTHTDRRTTRRRPTIFLE